MISRFKRSCKLTHIFHWAWRCTFTNNTFEGKEVVRTGRGSDYRERKRDPWTGRVTSSRLVEVKSGKAKLSKLQRKTKKRKSNYTVKRVNPLGW